MLNCVDLFCGAGGFSLAAKQAGLNVRLAIDNDPHAMRTYQENLCKPPYHTTIAKLGDLSSMSANNLLDDCFGNDETCDLLLGGPPCQGFSTHRIKNAGVQDVRNNLIHIYFDFVKAFQPKAFLMENVPGMLWPRHRDYIEQFYDEGRESGYILSEPVVLDARDFGIPQRRKRVFILGLRSDVKLKAEPVSWPPKVTHGSETAREINSALKPWKNCEEVFRPTSGLDPNNIHMNHSPELVSVFASTPKNGGSRKDSGRTLKCHKNHNGHKDVYGRIDPRDPAPTITASCINPSKGRFVHPTENHGITVREAARLQTFPEKFIFHGGLTAAGRQIGNAVPVALGKILIQHILPILTPIEAKPTLSSDVLSKHPADSCRTAVHFGTSEF